MPIKRITSVELHAHLGATIDSAVVDPLIVTKHGRDHLVMLSAERYAKLLASAEGNVSRTARLPSRKARSA